MAPGWHWPSSPPRALRGRAAGAELVEGDGERLPGVSAAAAAGWRRIVDSHRGGCDAGVGLTVLDRERWQAVSSRAVGGFGAGAADGATARGARGVLRLVARETPRPRGTGPGPGSARDPCSWSPVGFPMRRGTGPGPGSARDPASVDVDIGPAPRPGAARSARRMESGATARRANVGNRGGRMRQGRARNNCGRAEVARGLRAPSVRLRRRGSRRDSARCGGAWARRGGHSAHSDEIDHPFRWKPITRSGANRSPVPTRPPSGRSEATRDRNHESWSPVGAAGRFRCLIESPFRLSL